MSKTIRQCLILGLCLFAVVTRAATLRDDAPSTYVVKAGDTLWDIAETYFYDPFAWPTIWQGNSQIDNPDLIYPGDVIRLVFVDGQPKLIVNGNIDGLQNSKSTTVKLSPRIRSTLSKSPIPLISGEIIGPFLSQHRIVNLEEFADAPRILAGADRRLLLSSGDRFYARGDWQDAQTNTKRRKYYGIYKLGRQFRDPMTDQPLGQEITQVGTAQITAFDEDIATLELTSSSQQIVAGDRLLALNPDRTDVSDIQPKRLEQSVGGEIIAIKQGIEQVGRNDIVVINLGQEDGLDVGSMLQIMQQGKVVKDDYASERVRLPADNAGTLLTFDVFNRLSYGLIVRSLKPIAVGDTVTSQADK